MAVLHCTINLSILYLAFMVLRRVVRHDDLIRESLCQIWTAWKREHESFAYCEVMTPVNS